MANDFRPSLSDTPRLRRCGQGVAQQFSPETPGDLDGPAWLGGRSSSVARSSLPLPGRSADLRGSASARHAGAARGRRGWFSSDTAAAEGPMLAMRRSQSSVPGQRRSRAACRLRPARSQRPKCGDVPQYAALLPNSFSFANRAQGHAETRNGASAADRRLGETVATATLAGPVTNLRIEVDRRRPAIASSSGAIAWSLSWRRGIHGPAALGSEALNDPGGSDGTQPGADDDTDDGAEQRDHDRLRADHGPDLTALHSDRAQQADLARALEHREHQRVDDADQGDHHREGEQDVDQPELDRRTAWLMLAAAVIPFVSGYLHKGQGGGGGYGLTGMRERAELPGGELLAAPTNHGFPRGAAPTRRPVMSDGGPVRVVLADDRPWFARAWRRCSAYSTASSSWPLLPMARRRWRSPPRMTRTSC